MSDIIRGDTQLAVLKYRKKRLNSSGSYDTVHLETEATLVLRSDGSTSVESSLSNLETTKLNNKSTWIDPGTDVLGLAPGYYCTENLTDAQYATMNLPEHVWHYEITVMSTVSEAKTTECYKTIVVQCGEDVRRWVKYLHWTSWSPWRRVCGVDSSGNLNIDTDFILPHGMTVNGWSNFEQIRCKNYGNPFECSQYIDFHAVGSDVDYTTRVYADSTGLLRMDPRPDPGQMSLRMSYATSSDPGAGSSLTSGDMILVYE